jgi:glycogen synthase
MKSMRVLQVSAEIYPLVKTGGLADVTGALPAALTAAGCDVRLLLPGFAGVLAGTENAETIATVTAPWGVSATIKRGVVAALRQIAYVIDAPPATYVKAARTNTPIENLLRTTTIASHCFPGLPPNWPMR